MAVRPTMDNKRKGKNGVFLPSHNDGGKAAEMGGLWYTWQIYKQEHPEMGFEAAEVAYYDKFLDGLEYQNAKHRNARQKKRCRTIEEYRKSEKTAPESTEYYLGDKDDHESTDTLLRVVIDFVNWRSKRFPNVRLLNLAGHTEEGAPHMVDRHVWVAHDEDGNLIVSQEKALEEMGVKRFDEVKYQADMAEAKKIKDAKKRAQKVSYINRFNNRKMSYTRECREKMIEIAKSYGVELITDPRKPGKNSISQAQHIVEDLERQKTALQLEIPALKAARDREQKGLEKLVNAHTDAVELLRGDMTAIQARQGVTALMDVLGASARPPETTVARRAIADPPKPGRGTAGISVYETLLRTVAKMDAGTSVECDENVATFP